MARLDVIAKEGTTLVAAHFLLQRIEVAEDALRGGQAVLPAVARLQIGDELPLPVGCAVEVMRKQPDERVVLLLLHADQRRLGVEMAVERTDGQIPQPPT